MKTLIVNTCTYCLAPYGVWRHRLGDQRLDADTAARLCQRFQAPISRLMRFFRPLPVFIGHPDAPSDLPVSPAVTAGHIQQLHAGCKGLYATIRWNAVGRNLISDGVYQALSPRWRVEPLKDGDFTPVAVVSAGITNKPNLPHTDLEPVDLASIHLDFPELVSARKTPSCPPDAPPPQRPEAQVLQLRQALEKTSRDFSRERGFRVELLVDAAIREGRLTMDQRASWIDRLRCNFDPSLATLEAMPSVINTPSRVSGLRQQFAVDAVSHEDFLRLVLSESRRRSEPFADTWTRLKRERPDLYDPLADIAS